MAVVTCCEGISICFHIIFFILAIVIAILSSVLSELGNGSPVFISAYVFLSLIYLFIIIESCCSRTARYLKTVLSVGELGTFMGKLKSALPTLTIHIECYHWVTRRHTVRSNGRTHTRTTRKKVVTHRATETIPYTTCLDISDDTLAQVRDSFNAKGTQIRLHLANNYVWDNNHSEAAFTELYESFVRKNTRDVHQNHWVDFAIPGFKEYIAVSKASGDSNYKKACLSRAVFYIMSVFLLSWAFRVFHNLNTNKIKSNVTKKLGGISVTVERTRQPLSILSQGPAPTSNIFVMSHAYDNPQPDDPPPSYTEAMKF